MKAYNLRCNIYVIELNDHKLEQFQRYYELLVEWNKVMNLTAITEKEDVIIKHFADSLLLAKYKKLDESLSVIDVGTGAGFPGIPLKIAFPGLKVTFDKFMNITEEKPSEHKQERVPMVDPCYYCLCRSCINNAESLTVNPEEVPYDWHPCFFCDICNNFDGESPENMEREECHEYVIDDYHARQNRKKIRIVR